MKEDFRIFTTLRFDPTLLQTPTLSFMHATWNQEPSPFYMLDLHRDRMLRAAKHWRWDAAVKVLEGNVGLANLKSSLETVTREALEQNIPQRVKILLQPNGVCEYCLAPTPRVELCNLFPAYLPAPEESREANKEEVGWEGRVPLKEPAYEVLLDFARTTPSEYTHFKTTERAMYDRSRGRAKLGLYDRKEVLVVNEGTGAIMEGSMTTPYLWRGGRWVTPPVAADYNPSKGSGGNGGTTRRWALQRNTVVEEDILADSLKHGEECWLSNGLRGFIFGRIKLQARDNDDD